jgi:predicted adenine nucleotide alpha hydrolase (AANH) superfamily ATPase
MQEYETALITAYFSNPNIHPQSEFTSRQMALKSVTDELQIPLLIDNWMPGTYFTAMESLDTAARKDKTVRCPKCWTLRLTNTIRYAAAHGYDAVSTTMLTSHYMNADTIERIGQGIANQHGISFIRPITTECEIKTKGFYKQNYCGCVYSLTERLEEKYLTRLVKM